jgi:hypothetical protein
MQLHFLHDLKPPGLIQPFPSRGNIKDVIVLLSQFHHLLFITDKVYELPIRKLLEWIWWKFSFTWHYVKYQLV